MKMAEMIIKEIEAGRLKQNDRLPSLNELCCRMKVSKETTLKGLNYLIAQGIIYAVSRKGYYVQNTDIKLGFRVFFMLDKMTTFKDELYQSFYNCLSAYGEIDVFFHHHNFAHFRQIIENNLHNYTHFVIITYLPDDPTPVLQKIPDNKLLILDAKEKGFNRNFANIYQDFEKDIYQALQKAHHLLNKYKRLILVAPATLYHLPTARKGLIRYCLEKRMPWKEIDAIDHHDFQKGNAFLTLAPYDIDEVRIIKLCHEKKWQLGKDIGLISYNDTPVKEVLEGGISVITTDFAGMGRKAAEMIITGEWHQLANESNLIIRQSL